MPEKNNQIIDSKDIKALFRIIERNWYIVLAFALLSAAIAYVYTYRIVDVYGAKTQILIKSNETYDYQSQIVKNIGAYGRYEDISNQIRVVKSFDLVQKTVEKLNLEVSYYIVGRLKTTEIFDGMPFTVNVRSVNSSLYNNDISLKIISDTTCEISYLINGEERNAIIKFNEEAKNKDFIFLISNDGAINEKSIQTLREIDYKFKVNNLSSLVRSFMQSLLVKNIDYTSILEITVEDELPQRAVSFLDTLSKVYIDYTLENQITVNENTIHFIDKQLDEVISIMSGIEQDLERYRSEKAILDLSREEQEYFRRLLEFDNQKRMSQLNLKSLQMLEEYVVQNKTYGDEKMMPASVFMIDGDEFLKNAISDLYSLQLLISSGSFEVKGTSPHLKEKINELENLKKDVLIYINNNRKAIIENLKVFDEEIAYYENIIKEIPKTQRDILNITRKLEVNEKMYLFLLEKRANTVIARAGIVSESKVIERARSIGIVKPDKTRILLMFVLSGAAISLIIVFIRTILSNKIQNTEELKEYTSLPIFGEIIYSKEGESNYNLAEKNPKSPVTEAFRVVRTNLEYLVSENSCKTIVITSHNPGEGKTFCSINLASIIAKADKKVLLLEFDLHKPKINKGLGFSAEVGLSNLLAGKADINEIIHPSHIENLDVIFSGPTPPNASELILSKHLNKIFEHGQKYYDYIIVDTPPIGLISDAQILMKKADATLFVLNVKFAKPEFIENATEIVNLNKVKNFGFVLNGVKMKKSKYYYNYGYGYGYGYGGGYFDEKQH